jgi:S1-C subfamily serine protease
MRRLFLVPFIAALLGGGVVVAIVAAAGDLGDNGTKTVTAIQSAPLQPSNASQQTHGLTPHEVYERTAPGVVFISSTIVQRGESPFGLFGESQRQGQANGSGIVIDTKGTILTNYHVIANAIKVTVSFEKGKTVEAKVVGKDPSNDLAVLSVPTDGLTLRPIPLGADSAVQVGDPVLAIGNPFDLQRTLTTGVVSALQRTLEAPNGFRIHNVIQTDAAINPGNSGGPLLNAAGQVIGINSQIETGSQGGGSVGIGFAVPIDTAKSEISQLEKGGSVANAYLGVSSRTVDSSMAALNLPVKEGALVLTVQKGSPASKAGIKGGVSGSGESGSGSGSEVSVGGDIIVGVDGKKVATSEDLATFIGSKKPGDTVTINLYRANGHGGWELKSLHVTLAARPTSNPFEGSSGGGGGNGSPEG